MPTGKIREDVVRESLQYFQSIHHKAENALRMWSNSQDSITQHIQNLSKDELRDCLTYVIQDLHKQRIPLKDIKYLFYWMLREGGQRLEGELQKFTRQNSSLSTVEALAGFLTELFIQTKVYYESFNWNSIEGTCRERIKRGLDAKGGTEFESIVRESLRQCLAAVQGQHSKFPVRHIHIYPKARLLKGFLGSMTYDVVMDYVTTDKSEHRIVVPCKGRATMGGGHAAIFTRDLITSSLNIKVKPPEVEAFSPPFVVAIVIAEQWGEGERTFLESWFCDSVIFHSANIREIVQEGDLPQSVTDELHAVIEKILLGMIQPKYLTLEKMVSTS